jgi:hypothetical protein
MKKVISFQRKQVVRIGYTLERFYSGGGASDQKRE